MCLQACYLNLYHIKNENIKNYSGEFTLKWNLIAWKVITRASVYWQKKTTKLALYFAKVDFIDLMS